MPPREDIVRLLETMAHELAWLGVIWHVVILAVVVASITHPDVFKRWRSFVVAAFAASVAIASFAYGSWFNAFAFTILAILGGVFARRNDSQGPAPLTSLAIGIGAIAFGWSYSHFAEAPFVGISWTAPIGVLPCPTLAVLAGFTILAAGSRQLARVVLGWTAFYAIFGVFRLGVLLDIGLFAACIGLLPLAIRRRAERTVTETKQLRRLEFVGHTL